MTVLLPRIPHVLLASTFVIAAFAAPAAAQFRPGNHKPGAMAGAAVADAGVTRIEASAVSWAAIRVQPENVASDPEEGGQVASKTAKPSVSEINVTKLSDKSTAKLSSAPPPTGEPGKLEYPNANARTEASLDSPPPAGTATVTVARGSCASGQHIPKLYLSTGGRAFELNDVDVGPCTDSGGNNQTCTLTYASLGG